MARLSFSSLDQLCVVQTSAITSAVGHSRPFAQTPHVPCLLQHSSRPASIDGASDRQVSGVPRQRTFVIECFDFREGPPEVTHRAYIRRVDRCSTRLRAPAVNTVPDAEPATRGRIPRLIQRNARNADRE
jgi:hypothetical protein